MYINKSGNRKKNIISSLVEVQASCQPKKAPFILLAQLAFSPAADNFFLKLSFLEKKKHKTRFDKKIMFGTN
jgi:hypothetical protein